MPYSGPEQLPYDPREGRNYYFIADSDEIQRRASEISQLLAEKGFGPGSKATIIFRNESGHFVSLADQTVGEPVVPDHEDPRFEIEEDLVRVQVGREFFFLKDLIKWREMSDSQLRAEVDRWNGKRVGRARKAVLAALLAGGVAAAAYYGYQQLEDDPSSENSR